MKNTVDWPDGFQTRLVPVVQGEFKISKDPDIALTTVLGSCISVCLFDDLAKVGGMNHYLLASGPSDGSSSLRYGAHAMELLINALLKDGATRSNLKAKVFGGGKLSGLFDDIGQRNSSFALNYLSEEGLPVLAQGLGGTAARRVNFHPTTGQARCAITQDPTETIEAVPEPQPVRPAAPIELF